MKIVVINPHKSTAHNLIILESKKGEHILQASFYKIKGSWECLHMDSGLRRVKTCFHLGKPVEIDL